MKPWQDYELPDQSLFPDQYRLLEQLSESSASAVFIGFDEKEQAQVIIKCFKNQAKYAFLREISAVYDMRHPHLVRCLNTFHRKDGVSCLVYEYIPDGTLADLLDSKKRLDIDSIFRCLNDILRALIYLHAQNRIHCDIKPANIFLRTGKNGNFDFVLGDLGAACFLKEAQEGNHVVGTPAYIAPERIRNQFFFNSDLYSLGVVAFELYTGYRPFTGTLEEITQANLTEIPSLKSIDHQPLRDLVDHLLVKSPQKRIQSASLVYAHLIKLQTQQLLANRQEYSRSDSVEPSGLERSGTAQIENEFVIQISPENPILDLLCLHTGDSVLIGLTYANYTDFIDPRNPKDSVKTVMHNNCIQAVGAATIAYATPTRIQQYDFNSETSATLIEQINNPKSFYFNNSALVFVDDFNVSYTDMADQSGFSSRSYYYLFNPIVGIFQDGSFYLSEGKVNEKLVKRDRNGLLMEEHVMDGPITVITGKVDEVVMGASLSINDQNFYSVWRVLDNGTIDNKLLKEPIKQISASGEAIYWLTQSGDLVSCNRKLEYKLLKKCALTTTKFTLSKDEAYFCTLDQQVFNQAVIRIFVREV